MALSFLAVLVVSIAHTFNYDRDYHIPADEVRESEDAYNRALQATEA